VELALLLPVFLLLSVGLLDLVHAWYIEQLITNASREAARYATRYQADAAGVRKTPSTYSPSISDWIKLSSYNNYDAMLPSDANLTVTPSGTGYTSTTSGTDLTVTVSATKTWWVLGTLIPGLGNSRTVTVFTKMKLE
jgi:Flp pilus assembly protein TadG